MGRITRRWESSARRARAYAPRHGTRRTLRPDPLPLALRRMWKGRESAGTLVVQARLRALLVLQYPLTRVSRMTLRREHTERRWLASPSARAPSAGNRNHQRESRGTPLPRHGVHERREHLHERLTTSVVVHAPRPAALRVNHWFALAGARSPRLSPPGQQNAGAATQSPRPEASRGSPLPPPVLDRRTIRARWLNGTLRPGLALVPRARAAVTRRRAERRAADVAVQPAIDMHVVHRSAARNNVAGVQPLTAATFPLVASPARTAHAEPFPVERIERTLRESLTSVTERAVQREIERTLRPGAAATRRLRESIQSEMYDDVVFERERRGGR